MMFMKKIFNSFIVLAALIALVPGCRKEDFGISINENLLTVSFSKKQENTEKNPNSGWVRNEYMLRSFSRSFTLDETVDVNRIEASYTDGILTLKLPKNEKAKKISRNVEIK